MENYNVECMNCEQVFPVSEGSLWWRAKKAADHGRLDAIGISGVECGCKQTVREPEAPYRLFGYTDMGREYDIPFHTFVAVAKAFRERWSFGEDVFISGVSRAVEDKLKYG